MMPINAPADNESLEPNPGPYGHPFELPWWNDYLDAERDGAVWDGRGAAQR